MSHIAIDAFAGGGGASEGLRMAGVEVGIAINHDPEAIRMHTVNHPKALHLTEDVFKVDLANYLQPDDVVDVMWASPDCTSHSKAKGGQPRERGLRMLPWAVHRLCIQIREATGKLPKVLLMENVEEIQDWGPLDENGHRIKERNGEDYQEFVEAMQELGFTFESRVLVAADYGAATTRKRWYAVLRSDGKPIVFPKPTHSKDGSGGLKRWVPVAGCLDFSDLGESIFTRKHPLKEATLKRIANGIRKYIVESPNPYFLDKEKAFPFLIQYHGETKAGDARGQVITEPIKTIDTSNRYSLVSVCVEKKSEQKQCENGGFQSEEGVFRRNAERPEQECEARAAGEDRSEEVAAFLVKYYGTGCGQQISDPIATITTKDRFGMVSCVMDKASEAEETPETPEAAGFLTTFYGQSIGVGLDEPIGTITTNGHYGLVSCILDGKRETYQIRDILFRMLKPEEMKLAQGFPKSYVIDHDSEGNRYPKTEQVAKIGNSVVPLMAAEIARANLAEVG